MNSPSTRLGRLTVMTKQQGFSLIELLIVVAIILIIAAIAIPNLLRSKAAANEAAGANSMAQVAQSNIVYVSTYSIGYAGTMAQLGPPSGACAVASSGCADLLDAVLSGVNPANPTPLKNGYRFTYYAVNAVPTSATPNGSFALVGTPVVVGVNGTSTFCNDQRLVILRDTLGTQTTADNTGCTATWPLGGSIAPL